MVVSPATTNRFLGAEDFEEGGDARLGRMKASPPTSKSFDPKEAIIGSEGDDHRQGARRILRGPSRPSLPREPTIADLLEVDFDLLDEHRRPGINRRRRSGN